MIFINSRFAQGILLGTPKENIFLRENILLRISKVRML